MAKGRWTRELWVGFLGILALLILYVLINFFKGVNLVEEENTFYATFDNVEGIVNTSPVYVNGYKVGNVQDVVYDFAGGKGAVVKMSLDKRLSIPKGSRAEVKTALLGSSTVNIIMGDGNVFLAPGDTIQGRLDGGAMGEAAKMIPAVSDVIPKVDSLLVSLNSLVADSALRNTLGNIEQLTAQLNSTSAELDRLIKGDVSKAAGKLVALEDEMLELSSKLNEIEYKELVASLEASLKNIEAVTAALDNGEGTAGKLLKDDALYIKLNQTCEAATALLEDLKKNPKRYVHFSVFGKKDKGEE